LRLHVRVEARHVHAERHLAKAGVASVKGRGISHPCSAGEAGTERAKRSGGLHKRSAEDWGDPLTRATGAEPLSEVCLPYCARLRADLWGGRCGKERPAEVGGGGRYRVQSKGGNVIPEDLRNNFALRDLRGYQTNLVVNRIASTYRPAPESRCGMTAAVEREALLQEINYWNPKTEELNL
jgi:hypothetical protein